MLPVKNNHWDKEKEKKQIVIQNTFTKNWHVNYSKCLLYKIQGYWNIQLTEKNFLIGTTQIKYC